MKQEKKSHGNFVLGALARMWEREAERVAIVTQLMAVTGLPSEQIKTRLKELPCEPRAAMTFYIYAKRWPSHLECRFLSKAGTEAFVIGVETGVIKL